MRKGYFIQIRETQWERGPRGGPWLGSSVTFIRSERASSTPGLPHPQPGSEWRERPQPRHSRGWSTKPIFCGSHPADHRWDA